MELLLLPRVEGVDGNGGVDVVGCGAVVDDETAGTSVGAASVGSGGTASVVTGDANPMNATSKDYQT